MSSPFVRRVTSALGLGDTIKHPAFRGLDSETAVGAALIGLEFPWPTEDWPSDAQVVAAANAIRSGAPEVVTMPAAPKRGFTGGTPGGIGPYADYESLRRIVEPEDYV